MYLSFDLNSVQQEEKNEASIFIYLLLNSGLLNKLLFL